MVMERVRTVVRHQEAESEPHRRLHRSCVQTEAQRREQLRALQQLIWKRDHWQFRYLSGLFFPRHFCEFLRRVRPPLFSTGAALIEQPTSTAHRELFVLLPLPPAESASALLCAVANPAPPRRSQSIRAAQGTADSAPSATPSPRTSPHPRRRRLSRPRTAPRATPSPDDAKQAQ